MDDTDVPVWVESLVGRLSATIMLIEVCVDDLASARNAVAGGADRLELCDNLGDGGTTPSHGTLTHLLDTMTIPVFPIVRPRGGGFVYDADEQRVMLRDMEHIRSLGAVGVVGGALTPTGDVDVGCVARLRDAAGPMAFTFHRAIDVCRDPAEALEQLVALGVTRVLTSGQRATAWEGRATIAALQRQGDGRIIVMAGGGIAPSHTEALVRETGVVEVHVRAAMAWRDDASWSAPPVSFRKAPPDSAQARWMTDPVKVAAIKVAAEAACIPDHGERPSGFTLPEDRA